MKVNRFIGRLASIIILIFVVATGCKKEEPAAEQKTSSVAEISTGGVSHITQAEATFEGTVIKEGASAVSIRGFCWGVKPSPTVSDNFSQNAFGPGTFTHRATGLTKNTLYYVRAYATNAAGTVYGNEVNFTTVKEYKVGDIGPGGGLVFYVNVNGGGMEAAPVSTEKSAPWGCYGFPVSQTSWTIGSGKNNTNNILASCTTPGIAADLCDKLEINNYSDWFLPSQDELDLMYKVLKVNGKGDFMNSYYWSSSELSAPEAYALDFTDGAMWVEHKGQQNRVRAVRLF